MCGASGSTIQLWRVLQGRPGLVPSALPAGRVIKPQVINQAVGLPASGSLYSLQLPGLRHVPAV